MKLTSKTMNAVGTGIAFIGGLILFKWGPPQPDFGTDFAITSDGPRAEEYERRQLAKKRVYKVMSALGLAFITLGFLLQTLTVFMDD
jgi:hypothetical protein